MTTDAQREAVARRLCAQDEENWSWKGAPEHYLERADEIIAAYEAADLDDARYELERLARMILRWDELRLAGQLSDKGALRQMVIDARAALPKEPSDA